MGNAIPKTGFATRIREAMRARRFPFTTGQICDDLGVPHGPERQRAANIIGDFLERGEITKFRVLRSMGPVKHYKYRYNRSYKRKLTGDVRKRAHRAMYVSGTFSASDIERLTGEKRNSIELNIRKLMRSGRIAQVARRKCAGGPGMDRIFHILNRDAFRKELL